MKYLIFMLFLGLGMTACKHNNDHSHKAGEATEATDAATDAAHSGPEYTSAYVCQMHCKGSGSAEPGNCPVCGMAYIANENYKADGHQNDSHEEHNH